MLFVDGALLFFLSHYLFLLIGCLNSSFINVLVCLEHQLIIYS